MAETKPETPSMAALRRVRDKLLAVYTRSPEVSLIDIGYDPLSSRPNLSTPAPDREEQPAELVVRVHVRRESSQASLRIPTEMDGVPIRVVIGKYSLE